MYSKIQNWEKQLQEATIAFTKQFGHLDEQKLNWKPNTATWSIAQNVEHLITTNQQYYQVIESIRQGKTTLPFTARLGFVTRFFGKMIYNALEPSRSRKIKTFAVFEPTEGSQIKGDILKRFETHQTNFIQFIKSCEDLLEKGQIISSPVNRQIVYSLEQAFDIITVHEFRHLNQASELMKMEHFGLQITND